MKVLFVINPYSGRKEQDGLTELIAEKADKIGFSYKIYRMTEGDQEKRIRDKIAAFKPEIVAAAGGDGTVNLMAKILGGSKISLLIIPYGSANGMAKELEIGNRVDYAMSLLNKGKIHKIDLLLVNDNTCIHLADIGLNARIVKRFENDPKRGVSTYAKHLLAELFLIKQYRFYINHDGKEIKRRAVSITFANASKYGTGAVINPGGKLDDGWFELVIVKPFPPIKLLSIAWKMFTGTLKSSEYVEVIRCRKAKIISPRKTTLQVDGEIIGRVNEINIEIRPKAIGMMVPADFK